MGVEFLYDNLVDRFVVYDDGVDDVVYVGGDEAVDVFMLALFNVVPIEGVSDE